MPATAVLWLKVCAALPAVGLIGGGIALTAMPDSASDSDTVIATKRAPATVVPDVTPDAPAAPAPPSADPTAVATPQTPDLVPIKAPVPGFPGTGPATAGDGKAAPGRPASIRSNVPGQPPAVVRRAPSPGSTSAPPAPAPPRTAPPSTAPPSTAPPSTPPPSTPPPSP